MVEVTDPGPSRGAVTRLERGAVLADQWITGEPLGVEVPSTPENVEEGHLVEPPGSPLEDEPRFDADERADRHASRAVALKTAGVFSTVTDFCSIAYDRNIW